MIIRKQVLLTNNQKYKEIEKNKFEKKKLQVEQIVQRDKKRIKKKHESYTEEYEIKSSEKKHFDTDENSNCKNKIEKKIIFFFSKTRKIKQKTAEKENFQSFRLSE